MDDGGGDVRTSGYDVAVCDVRTSGYDAGGDVRNKWLW